MLWWPRLRRCGREGDPRRELVYQTAAFTLETSMGGNSHQSPAIFLSAPAHHAGLAAGFGVRCGVVGARGLDENGAFYQSSMARSHVRTDRLRALDTGATGTDPFLRRSLGDLVARQSLGSPIFPPASDLQQSCTKAAWHVLNLSASHWLEAPQKKPTGLPSLGRSCDVCKCSKCRVQPLLGGLCKEGFAGW